MLLTLDVGNTNTVLGLFHDAELVAHWRLTTARDQTVDEYGILTRELFTLAGIDPASVSGVISASYGWTRRSGEEARCRDFHFRSVWTQTFTSRIVFHKLLHVWRRPAQHSTWSGRSIAEIRLDSRPGIA